MKKILIVSPCGKRRDTIGLVGFLLADLKDLDRQKYHISLLDTNSVEKHNPKDYDVEEYHGLDKYWYSGLVRLIPRIRAYHYIYCAVSTYRRLINEKEYDIVLVYQVPVYADQIVSIAHRRGVKVAFEPFGSDILRVNEARKKRLKQAFRDVDVVIGRPKTGTMIAAQEMYNVPDEKIREQKLVVKGVKTICEVKGKKSRKEMMADMDIPYSDYNIVCGYSGRMSHRHKDIIDSLIKVKDVLPKGYQIVFPMTYGAGTHHEIVLEYAAELKSICESAGLKATFLTKFLSEEHLAYLHLVTDLFIEIQPTDNGNAFMIEALYAENQIVTGRWLNYQQFEQFGTPYYLIDRPEDLPQMLRRIFAHEIKKAIVPSALLDYLKISEDYNPGTYWARLFDELGD